MTTEALWRRMGVWTDSSGNFVRSEVATVFRETSSRRVWRKLPDGSWECRNARGAERSYDKARKHRAPSGLDDTLIVRVDRSGNGFAA